MIVQEMDIAVMEGPGEEEWGCLRLNHEAFFEYREELQEDAKKGHTAWDNWIPIACPDMYPVVCCLPFRGRPAFLVDRQEERVIALSRDDGVVWIKKYVATGGNGE